MSQERPGATRALVLLAGLAVAWLAVLAGLGRRPAVHARLITPDPSTP